MTEYHKINTCFKRDMGKSKKIIIGEWTDPSFEYLKDNIWLWDEKVDGTNIRVYWDGENVTYGGRTDNAQIPNGVINRLNDLFYSVPQKLRLKEVFPEGGVTFYGEGFGPKIQKGGENYGSDQDFVLFDVKIKDTYLERTNVWDVAGKIGLTHTPEYGQGTLMEAIESVRKGMKSTYGDFIAEGLVLRPLSELNDRRGNRIITKIKHVDFLGL